MKFGIREICDVVFKALQTQHFGNITVAKGQPVLYIDSAKTSTIESASSTVYATGGHGNSRLIAWEGEKTLTFTVEDALLSPIGFAVLSGAGLIDLEGATENIMVHCVEEATTDADTGNITLEHNIADGTPVFVLSYEKGSIGDKITVTKGTDANTLTAGTAKGKKVLVDYYTKAEKDAYEIQIDAENFAGYYYVEASTLVRRESDGVDLPAEIVFPKVKIQSNFTLNMSNSGDPSTFTFTMDAMPAYTMFNKDKKVLCAIQILKDTTLEAEEGAAVLTLEDGETADIDGVEIDDSVTTA